MNGAPDQDRVPVSAALVTLGRELGVWAASARRIEDDLGTNGLTPFVRQEADMLRQHLEQLERFVVELARHSDGSADVAGAVRSINLSALAERLRGGDVRSASQECELW